jgi:hypothetical protein
VRVRGYSHARATAESRFAVAREIPIAHSVSSIDKPAKKRNSINRVCSGFMCASACEALRPGRPHEQGATSQGPKAHPMVVLRERLRVLQQVLSGMINQDSTYELRCYGK